MNLQHHFLIAMPALQDPIFRRSVVYICEHNTNGAMGIIVNKPLEKSQIEGILEKLKITPEPRDESIRLDKPVMLGGPLAEDRGFILHTPPFQFCFQHSHFRQHSDDHFPRCAGNARHR